MSRIALSFGSTVPSPHPPYDRQIKQFIRPPGDVVKGHCGCLWTLRVPIVAGDLDCRFGEELPVAGLSSWVLSLTP